jgi:hypothetical protein
LWTLLLTTLPSVIEASFIPSRRGRAAHAAGKRYQPYERIGLWLRMQYLPTVRRILLGEECADRGVFDTGAVRCTLDEHAEGKANHSYLILGMLAFEAGQQELLSAKCDCSQPIGSSAS